MVSLYWYYLVAVIKSKKDHCYKALFDTISDKKSDTDEPSLNQPARSSTDEDDLSALENQILIPT
jgi:hypothetical protein